ncbi:MAG: AmmeMemoRadiSam system radical SAM enzyme [Chloroflexaceae bacterium]
MPKRTFLEPGVIVGEWWHRTDDDRWQCDLCPRGCRLREGQRGFCFIRQARNGVIALTSYGRASGFCIDPIEKKPLYHFYPGTAVLSFGTAGCNLGCRFCQNWDISKARSLDRLCARATPAAVADAAVVAGCHSIAFTYNDPVIFAEYAIDCAEAAHARGLRTVAVSAGYINPAARKDFFAHMDAANIDLKAIDQDFYRQVCLGDLAPVLDTLRYLFHETTVWLEVTNLLIPGHNDAPEQVTRLCEWLVTNLGPDVPLHLSAFYPAYRMLDVPPTPRATLIRAREQALAAGLRYVYTGNIHNPPGETTTCPACGMLLIERDWYRLGRWNLDDHGRCGRCGAALPGRFEPQPGHWGRRCVPVEIDA